MTSETASQKRLSGRGIILQPDSWAAGGKKLPSQESQGAVPVHSSGSRTSIWAVELSGLRGHGGNSGMLGAAVVTTNEFGSGAASPL